VTVALLSCFRNSNARGHLVHWHTQCLELQQALADRGDVLRLIASEGDSTDNTLGQLQGLRDLGRVPIEIVDGSHGGPDYGATTAPERMTQFAHAANQAYHAVCPTDDVVINVESDLRWDAATMLKLIDDLQTVDVVAPAVFLGDRFYDTWAFRKNNLAFRRYPPYHRDLNPRGLTPMDSVGSCLVMIGDVARWCRVSPVDAVLGFCRQARAFGFHIAVDWRLKIHHP
jgi:hypothetical protein